MIDVLQITLNLIISLSFLSRPAPTASILGGPDFYVQKGSTINLTCTIRLGPDESPAFIFWYHEDEVMSLCITEWSSARQLKFQWEKFETRKAPLWMRTLQLSAVNREMLSHPLQLIIIPSIACSHAPGFCRIVNLRCAPLSGIKFLRSPRFTFVRSREFVYLLQT